MKYTLDEQLKTAYDKWQEAMIKAAKSEDEQVFIWTDHEGLKYQHLPPPVDISAALPHLDAFHKYWVAQKHQPGFEVYSLANSATIHNPEILADFLWCSHDENIVDEINKSNKPIWHEVATQPGEKIEGHKYIVNPFKNLVHYGQYKPNANITAQLSAGHYDYVLIDAAHFHNCGAAPTWEIAIALAIVDEVLSAITDEKLRHITACKLLIKSAVGVMQLLEIAKLRALRFTLYNLLGKYFENAPYSKIFVESSKVYYAHQDTEINLIRHTSEAISAACGGADAIMIHPHNGNTLDREAMRLATNIPILLKEEAQLDKVIDPYAGSYYLEHQTDTLAKAAWEHLLWINNLGGFTAAMLGGHIQKEVRQYRNHLHQLFKENNITGIGINKYTSSFAKTSPAPTAHSVSQAAIDVLEPFYLFS